MKIIKEIENIIEVGINNNIFPSSCIGIYNKENNIFNKKIIISNSIFSVKNKSINKKHIFYDLASLTKPLATVLSVLSLKYNGKIRVEDNLGEIFDVKDVPADKENITVGQLLSHSAGFPAHQPFFIELVKAPLEKRKYLLFKFLMEEPLCYVPGESFIYSDLGFMLLGLIVEKLAGVELDEYLSTMILQPVGLEDHLFFNRQDGIDTDQKRYAPAEDCSWRGRVLSGEVSDENCWALGGVAGHAGLFGDIQGVLDMVALILDIWKGRASHPNIESKDLAEFLKIRSGIEDNTWALGFDTPSPVGSSSGKYLSATSVGHLGFTGTSFWIDPERELAIVVLSNRVHPSRENTRIKEFRPFIHDRVVELLGL
jgi:CubicO group peptidase (beta-lactamase class C family)